MATRLRFPRGTTHRYLLSWTQGGTAVNLLNATFSAFLKRSEFDDDADALVDLSGQFSALDLIDASVILTMPASATAELDPFTDVWWVARVVLAGGDVLELEAHHGPVLFSPIAAGLDSAVPQDGISETLEPDGDIAQLPSQMTDYIHNDPSILTLTGGAATSLDGYAALTLAALASGTKVQLSFAGSAVAQYRLRARTVAELEVLPHVVLCDHDADRCWELEFVTKQAQPCAWNAGSSLWYRVWGVGADGATVPAMDEAGFSLPA